MNPTDCIACGSENQRLIISLGEQPLANSYVTEENLDAPEPRYPLDLYICEDCMHVHIEVVATSQDIFSDYAYFSSYSTSWLEHAKRYVDMTMERFGLNENSQVIEVASNDGYLLQYFKERGVPCLGIEPAENVAEAAIEKGIPTRVVFWGDESARALVAEGFQADLMIGNNVLAHMPNLNDFVGGFKPALAPHGVVTFECPHLYRLIEQNQFDTIYHEHFSYYSFHTVRALLAKHGIAVFDVEELRSHGGSLRIFGRHTEDESHPVTERVEAMLALERDAGMMGFEYYEQFADRVAGVKKSVWQFLDQAAADGKRVAGYGAPAKGNTLLNYCSVGPEQIGYTVDRSPHKRGLYLPGTHIGIRAPEAIAEDKPDYLFILAWNLKDEIVEQMSHIRDWGGKFVTPIPEVRVLD